MQCSMLLAWKMQLLSCLLQTLIDALDLQITISLVKVPKLLENV